MRARRAKPEFDNVPERRDATAPIEVLERFPVPLIAKALTGH